MRYSGGVDILSKGVLTRPEQRIDALKSAIAGAKGLEITARLQRRVNARRAG